MAVHRPSPGGMAQCRDLFDPHQLPAEGIKPAGVSHRCPGSLAVRENHPNPGTPPCPLEASLGENALKRHAGMGVVDGTMKKLYTHKQGQYLAFIYHYTRIHRRAPAEAEMQQYFRVSPPSVHQMVLTLERAGFIRRKPRIARSIELLVDPENLPDLR